MGPSGFPVIIESQAIMVSTRVAIGKLIHALEVWSDGPRLPNIEPLQHEPSTADSTAIQRCIGQYIFNAWCTQGVVMYCKTALYILRQCGRCLQDTHGRSRPRHQRTRGAGPCCRRCQAFPSSATRPSQRVRLCRLPCTFRTAVGSTGWAP